MCALGAYLSRTCHSTYLLEFELFGARVAGVIFIIPVLGQYTKCPAMLDR